MGKYLHLKDLTKREFELGKCALKVLETFDISECELKSIVAIIGDYKRLLDENEEMKEEIKNIKEIMNNNNAHFEKMLQDLGKNFKIGINEENKGQDFIHLNLDEYERND